MTVQGGSFYRSYDGIGNYNMGYPAMVSSFVLDKYEVTVGRFRAFVNAGKGTQASPPVPGSGVHPNLAGSGWNSAWTASLATNTTALVSIIGCGSWTAEPGANENKPMNCVTSYEAMAFCIWDGGYLPTEAEWNYAASGGDEQRAYPWSNPATSTLIDCSYANYNLSAGTYCVNGMIGAVNRVATESPKGDGRWEHADLAGNVWEWTLDWHADPYPTSTCNDCANLTESIYRVIRGGSFINDAPQLRTANRAFVYPFDHNAHVGLRCARAL